MISKSPKVDYEGEIDLIEIYETIIEGKWKIFISIIFFLILGIVYVNFNSNYKLNNYVVSLNISPASQSQFSKYINLNDILSDIPLPLSKETEKGVIEQFYEVTPKSVFDEFIIQYNQRLEIIKILSEKPYGNIFTDGPDIEDQILSKAKDFLINSEGDELQKYYKLYFIWPEKKDIKNLGNATILNTLQSVKKTLLDDLNFIKLYVDNQNQKLKNKLQKDIIFISNQIFEENRSNLIFLNEQSRIAKSLGIFESLHSEILSNSPYYFRGSKAIDQEIEILLNRSKENELILSKEYLSLTNQLKNIENDETTKQIQGAIDLFSEEEIKNWVNYNLSFAEIENLKKKSHKVFIFSIILGLFVGFSVVIISKAINLRKIKNI